MQCKCSALDAWTYEQSWRDSTGYLSTCGSMCVYKCITIIKEEIMNLGGWMRKLEREANGHDVYPAFTVTSSKGEIKVLKVKRI